MFFIGFNDKPNIDQIDSHNPPKSKSYILCFKENEAPRPVHNRVEDKNRLYAFIALILPYQMTRCGNHSIDNSPNNWKDIIGRIKGGFNEIFIPVINITLRHLTNR